MNIKEKWLQWYTNFLIKSQKEVVLLIIVVVVIIIIINKICNSQKNYTEQLLENFKKEQFILDLKIIFGVLIWLIYNQ